MTAPQGYPQGRSLDRPGRRRIDHQLRKMQLQQNAGELHGRIVLEVGEHGFVRDPGHNAKARSLDERWTILAAGTKTPKQTDLPIEKGPGCKAEGAKRPPGGLSSEAERARAGSGGHGGRGRQERRERQFQSEGRAGLTNSVKYHYCMRLVASFAGIAKPGQRRWIQGPVTKVFVGSNPIRRT